MPIKDPLPLHKIGRGIVFIDKYLGEALQGERDVGSSSAFTVSQEPESYDHISYRRRVPSKDGSYAGAVTLTGALEITHYSQFNLGEWLLAEEHKITQLATPVVGEVHSVRPDLQYQLGATADNPLGVRKISALTVARVGQAAGAVLDEEVEDVSPGESVVLSRAPITVTSVKVGAALASAVLVPASENYTVTATGLAITAGSSAIAADSTLWVTYEAAATAGVPYVLGTDYDADLENARIHILLTGAISAAAQVVVSYTPSAEESVVLRSGSRASSMVAIRVLCDNEGNVGQEEWYFPKVLLKPSGELSLIATDGAFATTSFELEILTPANGRPIHRRGASA